MSDRAVFRITQITLTENSKGKVAKVILGCLKNSIGWHFHHLCGKSFLKNITFPDSCKAPTNIFGKFFINMQPRVYNYTRSCRILRKETIAHAHHPLRHLQNKTLEIRQDRPRRSLTLPQSAHQQMVRARRDAGRQDRLSKLQTPHRHRQRNLL